jgi:electron transfer flavoprotein alpha subunit
MSDAPRIDPRRPTTVRSTGMRRVELIKRQAESPARPLKPLRTEVEPQQWLMAIAYADRGNLDEQARQAIAAAAILADPATGVIAVILGELTEDLAESGADLIAVLPDFDATRFQPERELAAVSALINAYKPKHIFVPDATRGEGDLGRRLAARLGATASTHVAEVSATHAAVRWSGGSTLASLPLPRVVLLDAGAIDADLPFVGAGRKLTPESTPSVSPVSEICRDLGLTAPEASAVALEEADFVVSAGHGVHNIDTLEVLAKSLGAAVGASRVAVDEGKLPRDRQIGATSSPSTQTQVHLLPSAPISPLSVTPKM